MNALATKLACWSVAKGTPLLMERGILFIALFLPVRDFRTFEAIRFALRFGI
jgi:hypothetical protein